MSAVVGAGRRWGYARRATKRHGVFFVYSIKKYFCVRIFETLHRQVSQGFTSVLMRYTQSKTCRHKALPQTNYEMILYGSDVNPVFTGLFFHRYVIHTLCEPSVIRYAVYYSSPLLSHLSICILRHRTLGGRETHARRRKVGGRKASSRCRRPCARPQGRYVRRNLEDFDALELFLPQVLEKRFRDPLPDFISAPHLRVPSDLEVVYEKSHFFVSRLGAVATATPFCARKPLHPLLLKQNQSFKGFSMPPLTVDSERNAMYKQLQCRLLYVTFLSLTKTWSWMLSATSAGPSGHRWVILHMLRRRLSPRPIWSGCTTWKRRPQKAVDFLLVVASTLPCGKLWKSERTFGSEASHGRRFEA